MGVTVDPMKLATGEPVTTDLMNTIIKNIQQVAAGPVNVSTINLSNTNTAIATTVVAVKKPITISSSASGGTKIEFDYTNTKFKSEPNVWVQIDTIGLSSPTYAQSVIFPQVISITTTKAKVAFRCAVNTKINATLFASGELA